MRLSSTRRYWDLLGYHIFLISGSNRPYDPGWIPLTRHDVRGIVACWCLKTIGPFQSGLFGTLHLHGRLYPLPLLLACFRTYASSNLLPAYLQGSIPGLWLAVTGAGFTPARICDIAQPQLRSDPIFLGLTPFSFAQPQLRPDPTPMRIYNGLGWRFWFDCFSNWKTPKNMPLLS